MAVNAPNRLRPRRSAGEQLVHLLPDAGVRVLRPAIFANPPEPLAWAGLQPAFQLGSPVVEFVRQKPGKGNKRDRYLPCRPRVGHRIDVHAPLAPPLPSAILDRPAPVPRCSASPSHSHSGSAWRSLSEVCLSRVSPGRIGRPGISGAPWLPGARQARSPVIISAGGPSWFSSAISLLLLQWS